MAIPNSNEDVRTSWLRAIEITLDCCHENVPKTVVQSWLDEIVAGRLIRRDDAVSIRVGTKGLQDIIELVYRYNDPTALDEELSEC